MLAYLEDLCGALIAHDADAIQRLLGHPLARSLPRPVREEAIAISRASAASLRAPIQTLRFYHQTLQLGAPGQDTRPSEPSEPGREPEESEPAGGDPDAGRGPSHMQGAPSGGTTPVHGYGRDVGAREAQGREPARHQPPHHLTGREQIELPLESPRKAQAA